MKGLLCCCSYVVIDSHSEHLQSDTLLSWSRAIAANDMQFSGHFQQQRIVCGYVFDTGTCLQRLHIFNLVVICFCLMHMLIIMYLFLANTLMREPK